MAVDLFMLMLLLQCRLLCTGPDGSNHQTMSNKLLEEAHVIVWACGYSANTSYRVLNGDGEVINLKVYYASLTYIMTLYFI